MYRVAQLPRKCLITVDEVLAMVPTEDAVNARIVLSSLQVAEERFIKPALGKELYNDFRDKKNVKITEDNKSALEDKFNSSDTREKVSLTVGDIVNAIEEVDDENYTDLWNEYLWKLTAECVLYVATPVNYSRFTAQGEVMNTPKTTGIEGKGPASVELKEIQWKMDKLMQDRIDPLMQSMKEWLYDNREKFDLYPKPTKEESISYKRKSSWIHGIYDDEAVDTCNDD